MPDFPFTTDGCSGGHSVRWRIFFGKAPPWQDCCVNHDRAYWQGGTRRQRLKADRALRFCVRANGSKFWAAILFIAVRIGGHPLLPFPWRWGYGWKFPRNYTKETKA